jgi:diguanylate cyclase (GGDEF)-like protein
MEQELVKNNIDKRLYRAANLKIDFFNKLHYKNLLRDKLPKNKDLENIKELSKFAKSMGVSYIYSFMQDKDGNVYFTSSSASDEDLENNDSSMYSFDRYEDSILSEVFQSKKSIFKNTSDKWGNFRTFYMPQHSNDGTLYVIGVDYKLEKIHAKLIEQMENIFYIFIPLFMLFVLSFIIFYTLLKYFEKKLEIKSKKLQRFFETDIKTNLPNRNKLINILSSKYPYKMALININNFKNINSIYGIEIGDLCLVKVAEIIKEKLDSSMQLYKLEADNFSILSADRDTLFFREEIQKLLEYLEHYTITVDSYRIKFSYTIGLSCSTKEDYVLISAEKALKKAKKSGNNFIIYDKNEEKIDNFDKRKVLDEINTAIVKKKILAYMQPIYNTKTKKIEKFEALMRLKKEDNTIESPAYFLKVAQDAGVYKYISLIMFENVISIAKKYSDYEFSFNISAIDIEDFEIQNKIINTLINENLKDRIVLEVLESEEFKNESNLHEFEKRAKTQGIRLSIDDFGSGYASFSNLIEFSFDYIKIDGSLVKNVLFNKKYELMISQIVSFARNIGSKTIAEFVENEEVAKKVISLGVDMLQGYYYSKPLSSSELDKYLT